MFQAHSNEVPSSVPSMSTPRTTHVRDWRAVEELWEPNVVLTKGTAFLMPR